MALKRTAKSCGPDASTLAFKSRGDICGATVTKKPDRRGEHEISCKTIARGMPGVSGVTVVTNARAYYQYTRGYGRTRRPAFPAPSEGRAGSLIAKLGRIAPRECEGVCEIKATSFRGDA